jgi:hypothetical protein
VHLETLTILLCLHLPTSFNRTEANSRLPSAGSHKDKKPKIKHAFDTPEVTIQAPDYWLRGPARLATGPEMREGLINVPFPL